MRIDCEKEYSPAVYEKLCAILSHKKRKPFYYPFVKRLFDIFLSLTLLILLAPLMGVIALAIKLTSKGPVLFRQIRIGKGGECFTCLKFRTMTADAPHDCPSGALRERERYITRVGAFLRRFSLDELPQLFSVLAGKMSLVGYRPLIPSESACHTMRQSLGVYVMRPGMTGYAQLSGRDRVLDKNKALLDAYYVRHASFSWDLELLCQTLISALVGRDNRDAG